jgi:WD40 repeat protein/serine/threonine protein kinase
MTTRFDNPSEDDFDEVLAQYADALAEGKAPLPSLPDSAPPEFNVRLAQMTGLLERLETDRLRSFESGSLSRDRVQKQCIAAERAAGTLPQVGHFQIKQVLGSGGFGVVYLAEDRRLSRLVALKVPNEGAFISADVRKRFVREAQAAAKLSHPNIVPVFEIGETGPLCYIVSAYCPGGTLADWLKQQTTPVPARHAALVLTALADAVHYAHENGILHRDLKPKNVLLQPEKYDGTDRAARVGFIPVIADFGLAKFLDLAVEASSMPVETIPNVAGVSVATPGMAGTPAYMAPEQAQGDPGKVQRGADVYALGAILYEMLSGKPAFEGHMAEVLRKVREIKPTPPGRLRPGLSRDLEAICIRCLCKEPADRYASARDLADDLRRWLRGEPVHARLGGPVERLAKWVRRRPALAGLFTVAGLGVLALLIGQVWHAHQLEGFNVALLESLDREHSAAQRADQNRRNAEDGESHARQQAYVATILLGNNLVKENRTGYLCEMLNGVRPAAGQSDLRGFEWYYLWNKGKNLCYLRGHNAPVVATSFTADGQRCLSFSGDHELRIWDALAAQSIGGWAATKLGWDHDCFSYDGVRLLSSTCYGDTGSLVNFWHIPTGQLLWSRAWPTFRVMCAALSPDGHMAALVLPSQDGMSHTVSLWDTDAACERSVWHYPRVHVTSVCFSDDRHSLAIACSQSAEFPLDENVTLRLLGLPSGREQQVLHVKDHWISALAFSPDGRTLASGSYEGAVKLWDLSAGRVRKNLKGMEAFVGALVFSRNGESVASGSSRGDRQMKMKRVKHCSVCVWDVASGALRADPLHQDCQISGVSFSPNGKVLAFGCDDNLVRLWTIHDRDSGVVLPGHQPKEAWCMAFAPDGSLLSGGDDHLVRVWDPATRTQRTELRGHRSLVASLVLTPDGKTLITGSYDGTVRIWDMASGQTRLTLEGHANNVCAVACSPDGSTLASAGDDQTIRIWDLATGQLRRSWSVPSDRVKSLTFSLDGKTLASGSRDRRLTLWEPMRGDRLAEITAPGEVISLAYSPNGEILAMGTNAGVIKLLHSNNLEQLLVLEGHHGDVPAVAFAPDGRTLASGGEDKTVRLWHVATGTELLNFKEQASDVMAVQFSRDGKTLASALYDGTIKVWRAATDSDPPAE